VIQERLAGSNRKTAHVPAPVNTARLPIYIDMTTGLEAGPRSVQTFRVYVDRRKRWHSLKIGIDARGRGGRTNDPKRHVAAPARAHPRRKRLLAESPHRRSLHAGTRLRLCQ